jgi:hypothetical protein
LFYDDQTRFGLLILTLLSSASTISKNQLPKEMDSDSGLLTMIKTPLLSASLSLCGKSFTVFLYAWFLFLSTEIYKISGK